MIKRLKIEEANIKTPSSLFLKATDPITKEVLYLQALGEEKVKEIKEKVVEGEYYEISFFCNGSDHNGFYYNNLNIHKILK